MPGLLWCFSGQSMYMGSNMNELNENQKKDYWNGSKNKMIRYYFYSQRGLALFNEFRYLFMLIFGIYYTLKLTNPIWLVVMVLVSVPSLILIGFYSVHYVGKVIDFLNVQFSTHWTKYQFQLYEQILIELQKLNKKT